MENEEHQSNELNCIEKIEMFFNDQVCPLGDSNPKIKEWENKVMLAIENAKLEYCELVEGFFDKRHEKQFDKQLSAQQFKEVYKWLGINLNTLGCIMLDLESIFEPPQDSDGLYYSPDKEKYWIDGFVAQKNPHITLLYGLLQTGKNYELHIKKLLTDCILTEVEIESIGYFDSPYPDEPYYCIVAHIKVTPELLDAHQRLEFLPHINTFTGGYKPHLTLAYVKKDDNRDNWIDTYKYFIGKKLKVKPELNFGGDK